jgi:hypothetical protein
MQNNMNKISFLFCFVFVFYLFICSFFVVVVALFVCCCCFLYWSVLLTFYRRQTDYRNKSCVIAVEYSLTLKHIPNFNNISVISSVLLVEETGVPGENHRPVASHWQTLPHNVTALVVIGTGCTGSYKSNYHTIMTTMAPIWYYMFNVMVYNTYILQANTDQQRFPSRTPI